MTQQEAEKLKAGDWLDTVVYRVRLPDGSQYCVSKDIFETMCTAGAVVDSNPERTVVQLLSDDKKVYLRESNCDQAVVKYGQVTVNEDGKLRFECVELSHVRLFHAKNGSPLKHFGTEHYYNVDLNLAEKMDELDSTMLVLADLTRG